MAKSMRPVEHAAATVVLVHGAWADGSSWSDVIAHLQDKGSEVVSVQNPLQSLSGDVAAVNRAIERASGPVVLVGHSWGGTVITQAGHSAKVGALVYVAAFAPDIGESTNDLQKDGPAPAYASLLEVDAEGFLWFPQADLPHWFAQDLPSAHAMVLAAAQNPVHAAVFDEKVAQAAWRSKPSWYLLTAEDRMIAPDLQRIMATRIAARTTVVHSSHVPLISHPRETAALILEAAGATAAQHG